VLGIAVHHKRKIAWFVNSKTKEVDYDAANNLSNLITLCRKCHKVADGHAERVGFRRLV
jgi:predicted HNH restriction endonuclease